MHYSFLTVVLFVVISFYNSCFSICESAVQVENMQVFVAQINRISETLQLKLKLELSSITSVENFLMVLLRHDDLAVNSDEEEIVQVEVYDNVEGKFVSLLKKDYFFQFLSTCHGPKQLVITISNKNTTLVPLSQESSHLMLKGRMLNIDVDGLPIANTVLRISSPGEAGLGTGLTIWDGSIVLAKYFEAFPGLIETKSILEVGSGTGIVGIVAGLLGAEKVVLTDLAYTLHNLQLNIDKNRPMSTDNSSSMYNVKARELDWFQSSTYPVSETWDLIVGADVVWIEELILPLVNTLATIATPSCNVLIAHQTRSKYSDDLFFSNMEKYFHIEKITFEAPEGYTSGAIINIFRFQRKLNVIS